MFPYYYFLGCEYKSLTEGKVGERLQSTNDRLKLLDFLITELLAARILSAKKPSTNVELCIVRNFMMLLYLFLN